MQYNHAATVAVDNVAANGRKKSGKKKGAAKVDQVDGSSVKNRPCPFMVQCGSCPIKDCWYSHSKDLCTQAKSTPCPQQAKYGRCFKAAEFFTTLGPGNRKVSKCPYCPAGSSNSHNVDNVQQQKGSSKKKKKKEKKGSPGFGRQGQNKRP